MDTSSSNENMDPRLEESATGGISQIINKKQNVLDWDEYFMAIAFLASMRSKNPRTQVGACIVDENKRIVGVGYNGFPWDCRDNEFSWNANDNVNGDSKYFYVCHAEFNAIFNKIAENLEDCSIYVTLFPCNECAKVIIQSGIKKIVYLSDKYAHKLGNVIVSKKMFDAAKVDCRQLIPKLDKIEIDFGNMNNEKIILDSSKTTVQKIISEFNNKIKNLSREEKKNVKSPLKSTIKLTYDNVTKNANSLALPSFNREKFVNDLVIKNNVSKMKDSIDDERDKNKIDTIKTSNFAHDGGALISFDKFEKTVNSVAMVENNQLKNLLDDKKNTIRIDRAETISYSTNHDALVYFIKFEKTINELVIKSNVNKIKDSLVDQRNISEIKTSNSATVTFDEVKSINEREKNNVEASLINIKQNSSNVSAKIIKNLQVRQKETLKNLKKTMHNNFCQRMKTCEIYFKFQKNLFLFFIIIAILMSLDILLHMYNIHIFTN